MNKVSKLGASLLASSVLLAAPVAAFAAPNPHHNAPVYSVKLANYKKAAPYQQANQSEHGKNGQYGERGHHGDRGQREQNNKQKANADLANQRAELLKQITAIQDKVATYSKQLDKYAVVVEVLPFPSDLQDEQQKFKDDLANASEALQPYESLNGHEGDSFGKFKNSSDIKGYIDKFTTVDAQVNSALSEVSDFLKSLQFPSATSTTGDSTTPADNTGATKTDPASSGTPTAPVSTTPASSSTPTTPVSTTPTSGDTVTNPPASTTPNSGTAPTSVADSSTPADPSASAQ